MRHVFKPQETEIFISYRRSDGLQHARIISLVLSEHGYEKVFFDFDSLRTGTFDSQIEVAIRSCKDFIIILSPDSMKRCYVADDWVARELRLAIKYSRNIIPVCINTSKFLWPTNFPPDLKRICAIQRHCMLTNEYFQDSMRMLARERLLTRPKRTAPTGTINISTQVSSKALPLLRETLDTWGTCRLASFTDDGMGVIIRDKNDFAYTDNIPQGMKSVLNSIKTNPYTYIAEVCITEYYWFVIYKDSTWHGKGYVPEEFKNIINKLFKKDILIRSITMNDNGDYIIVTNKGCYASREKDTELINNTQNGRIRAAHITNDSALISFERGIKGYGIPTQITQKLKEISKSPSLVCFTEGGLYLFADKDYYYSYL